MLMFPLRDASKPVTSILERRGESNIPKLAKIKEDWLIWRGKPRPERIKLAMALALGLHRDPTRARTHALVQEVVHVPRARDPRHRFRAARAGAFLLVDILESVEGADSADIRSRKEREEDFWRQSQLKTAQRDLLSVVFVTHEPQIGTFRIDVGGCSLNFSFSPWFWFYVLITICKCIPASKT